MLFKFSCSQMLKYLGSSRVFFHPFPSCFFPVLKWYDITKHICCIIQGQSCMRKDHVLLSYHIHRPGETLCLRRCCNFRPPPSKSHRKDISAGNFNSCGSLLSSQFLPCLLPHLFSTFALVCSSVAFGSVFKVQL